MQIRQQGRRSPQDDVDRVAVGFQDERFRAVGLWRDTGEVGAVAEVMLQRLELAFPLGHQPGVRGHGQELPHPAQREQQVAPQVLDLLSQGRDLLDGDASALAKAAFSSRVCVSMASRRSQQWPASPQPSFNAVASALTDARIESELEVTTRGQLPDQLLQGRGPLFPARVVRGCVRREQFLEPPGQDPPQVGEPDAIQQGRHSCQRQPARTGPTSGDPLRVRRSSAIRRTVWPESFRPLRPGPASARSWRRSAAVSARSASPVRGRGRRLA